MTRRADVLVIGGGPGGAAAAARLAGSGREVVLLERQAAARPQVCGEFLGAAALAELADLGLDVGDLGARPIGRARLFAGRSAATAALPFQSAGLSRTRLDQSLLDLARRRGALVRMGAGVRSLEHRSERWVAGLKDGGRVEGRAVVLATGKHDVRGHQRPQQARTVIGFKMHWRLDPGQASELGDAVELFLYDGGYAGLQPTNDGAVNLCLVVATERVRHTGDPWPALLRRLPALAPMLAARLGGAEPCWSRPASIARVPYGYVLGANDPDPELYRVGDQAAVIHSLAGEGIGIALRTGRLAANAIIAGAGPGQYRAGVRREVLGPVRRAGIMVAATRPRTGRRLGVGLAALPGVLPALVGLIRLPAGPGERMTTAGAGPGKRGGRWRGGR